jgi:Pyridine nucleotide-disulphide oxidoreductase
MGAPSCTTVCIIGAGPYGVSIAAHLQATGTEFRIFGSPMHRWRAQMPAGMVLKSEGCASNLSDPTEDNTLAQYCAQQGLPYRKWGAPVSREFFLQYALSFQQSLVPNVEQSMVTSVRKVCDKFEVVLNNDECLTAQKIIVATGLEHMEYTPAELRLLPPDLHSHSVDHYDLSRFSGKNITVIGGGQSALETAALLHEQGAFVRLLVRKSTLAWNRNPNDLPRTFYQRWRHPRTHLGDGLQLWLYAEAPSLFHYLPRRLRVDRAKAVLGPAGAWWLKERILGRVPILFSHSVCSSEARGDRAILHVSDHHGRPRIFVTDHVIAATGYRFQLGRLPFLSEDLKSQLRHERQVPLLSANFESSVAGLYFAGLASTYSFGPVMRFLHGTRYTARRICGHITGRRDRARVVPAVPLAGTSASQKFSGSEALATAREF